MTHAYPKQLSDTSVGDLVKISYGGPIVALVVWRSNISNAMRIVFGDNKILDVEYPVLYKCTILSSLTGNKT